MWWLRRATLFRRIFFGFMISVAVASILQVLLTAFLSRLGFLDLSLQGRLRQMLRRDGPALVEIYERDGADALREAMDRLRDESRIMVVLLDESGGPLEELRPPGWRGPRSTDHHRPPSWMASLPAVTESLVSSSGSSYIVTFFALPGVTPPADRIYLSMACYLGVFVIAGVMVSYLLARQIARPVESLSRASLALAAGDLAVRSEGDGRLGDDEIGQLARNFDAMADHVERTITVQNRLLGDISHELRSPLTRLNLSLEILKGKIGPDLMPFVDRLERESDRMNGMIGDLLDLARREASFRGGKSERFPLSSLLERVAKDGRFEALASGRDVVLLDVPDVEICGDFVALSSALDNVVRNGIRYTSPGTSVEVGAFLDKSAKQPLCVHVSDRGAGVAEENLGAIFRPFFREDEARTRESGGVGLGLAIARRAVESHGGEIAAFNREGGGLRVELRLPIDL